MKALKAHIRQGQIILDEPSDLPEGAAVEVLVGDHDALSTSEQAALDDSAAQFARGEFEDARAFARHLVAKA